MAQKARSGTPAPTKRPAGTSRKRSRNVVSKAARRAARRVRNLRGAFTVEPLANVTLLGPGNFKAETQDPQLSVKSAAMDLPVGWIKLRIRVAAQPEYSFSPQLFYDTGKGWREADSVRLPPPVNGSITAFLRLPKKTRKLRLDVGEARGPFGLSDLRIWEISGPEAFLQHLARVGLGLASFHPSHPWEKRHQLIPSFLQHTRRLLGEDAGSSPLSALPDEAAQAPRQARLALYASESNESRAQAAQQPRPLKLATGPKSPGISVIILNLNKPELIIPLLDRLDKDERELAQQGLRIQVLVGDTGSSDPQVLARYEAAGPDVLVERGLKYHFSRCNNVMARAAECDTLLFLNNDVIFPEDRNPLLEMRSALHAQPARGVVGSCLFYEDGLVQHIGVDFLRDAPVRGLCFHPRVRTRVDESTLKHVFRVPAVTGACLMMRHELFAQLGGMDESYAAECQDIDLCLAAARLGYESHVVHCGHMLHLENATRPKGEENWPDRQRFLRRWGGFIEASYL